MADQVFSVNSGFYDAVNSDRTYSADDMNRPYKRVVSNGVFATPQGTKSTDLQVVSANQGMQIIVKKGEGIFADKWFENPAAINITVPTNTSTVPRIDSVIVQVDKRTSGRVGNIVYRTGTPSVNPVAPSINTVSNVIEYRLANVRVETGTTAITTAMITDRRGSADCPWVTSLIYQVDTSVLYDQWAAAYEEYFEAEKALWDDWYSHLTEDLDVSLSLVKRTHTFVTTSETNDINIGIADYNENTDLLEVYINGMRAIEGSQYTISEGTNILLSAPLGVGQTVEFVALKSVIMGNPDDILSLISSLEDRIASIQGGNPTVVDNVSDMTDTDKIYILSTDSKWYYYSLTASEWTIGGTYGGVPTDTTLTEAGMAADAKTVGDAVSEINNEFDNAVYAYPYGIEPFQMSIFKRTQNLFSNFCYYRNKRYYRSRLSTSTVVSPRVTATLNYNGWLIRIKPNTTYTMGALDFKLELLTLDFYLDKTISTVSGTDPNTITTGANSYWMCLTQSVNRDMSAWMLVEGDTYPSEYVSGVPEFVYPLPDITAIENSVSTVSEGLSSANAEIEKIEIDSYNFPYGIEPFQMSIFKRTQNLFSNFCYYRNKHYYRSRLESSAVVEPRVTESLNYSGWLIRIKPNTTYTMGGLDYRLEFLTLDFYLDKTISSVSSSDPNTITTGEHSYWMCLTQSVNRDMSEWMLVEGDTYPSDYVSGKPQWVEDLDEVDHSDITIAFMGDSITAGVATTKCYHQYIHDKYGFTCLNYGFGGSGYFRNSQSQTSGRIGQGVPGIGSATTPENFFSPNNIVARLSELDASTVDLIVIFAGTNDWGNGVTIENYISGIESAFNYCLNNYTTIPVIVMTPIHRKNDTVLNSQGKTLREYVDILINECQKYSFPYIDTMTDSGIYPDNTANKEAFFVTDTSGLHPSASGHKRIANAVYERIANKVL